jgi:hypothetical protein
MEFGIGQIWEYVGKYALPMRFQILNKQEVFKLTSPVTAIEITELNKYINSLYANCHTCIILRDDHNILVNIATADNGHTLIEPTLFAEEIDKGEWRLLMENPNKIGSHCIKCKQYFPYTNYSSNFKCWSCKNFP